MLQHDTAESVFDFVSRGWWKRSDDDSYNRSYAWILVILVCACMFISVYIDICACMCVCD